MASTSASNASAPPPLWRERLLIVITAVTGLAAATCAFAGVGFLLWW